MGVIVVADSQTLHPSSAVVGEDYASAIEVVSDSNDSYDVVAFDYRVTADYEQALTGVVRVTRQARYHPIRSGVAVHHYYDTFQYVML